MKHKDARLGAALAYYSIFSLGPIVMIAITIAGLFFGEEIVRSQVGESIKGLMGETGAQAVNTMLTGANGEAEKGIVPTLIGVGALIFAAVGVVVQLKDALNTVWEVEDTEASGIWHFIRTYILSIAAVIAVGFLLLVSLLLTAVISAIGKYFSHIAPEALMQPIGFARLLPDHRAVVCHDVQMAARRRGVMAGCLAGRTSSRPCCSRRANS